MIAVVAAVQAAIVAAMAVLAWWLSGAEMAQAIARHLDDSPSRYAQARIEPDHSHAASRLGYVNTRQLRR